MTAGRVGLAVHWVAGGWQPAGPGSAWLTRDEVERWRAAGVHSEAFARKRWLLRRCMEQWREDSDAGPLVVEQVCPRCGLAGHGPVRARQGDGAWIRVSLAAHQDLAVAVSSRSDIGVDVVVADEAGDPALNPAFGARERDELERAADLPLERARLWARKEAALKAVGAGLRLEPDGVDVLDASVVVLGRRLQLVDGVVPGRRAVVAVAYDGPALALDWRRHGDEGAGH